jgi:hypothetical protein
MTQQSDQSGIKEPGHPRKTTRFSCLNVHAHTTGRDMEAVQPKTFFCALTCGPEKA